MAFSATVFLRYIVIALVSGFIVLGFSHQAKALDRRVTITNDTSVTIVRLFGSSVGFRNWETNILGNDNLLAGRSIIVDFDDGTGYCIFDFKFVFEDGDELVKKRINICLTGSMRLVDSE